MVASAKAIVTASTVRIMQQLSMTRSRRRRIPPPASTAGIERDYANRILSIMRQLRRELQPLLEELPALIERARFERQDVGEGRRARDLIEAARSALEGSTDAEGLEALAVEFARRIEGFQRVQMGRQVRAGLGADVFVSDGNLAALIDGFAAENAELIKDIPEQVLRDIAKSTTRAIQNATPHRELAKELAEKIGFGEKRARRIARDQVGKLYAKINETRFRAIGVDEYIWRTVGDRRVRPEHQALNGRRFRFSNPPPDGNPGEPIFCRCFAEPVFDQILGEIDEVEA